MVNDLEAKQACRMLLGGAQPIIPPNLYLYVYVVARYTTGPLRAANNATRSQ